MNKNTTIFVILLAIVAGIYLIDPLTFVDEQVVIPQYTSIECVPRANDGYLYTVTTHTDDPVFYHCISGNSISDTYIPTGEQCIFHIEEAEPAFSKIYTCDEYVTDVSDLETKCTRVPGTGFWQSLTSDLSIGQIAISSGQSIYVDTARTLGDAIVKAEMPSYGLKVETDDGAVLETTTNCYVSSASNQFHTTDLQGATYVAPDFPINAVTGTVTGNSNRLVSLPELNGGDPIYILEAKKYQKVLRAEDGFLYVDTTKTYISERVECIPGVGCSDDLRATDIVDQACTSSLQGYIWTPSQNEYCTYECVNGVNKPTNDCLDLFSCNDGEQLNPITGDCEKLSDFIDKPGLISDVDWFIVTIIAMGGVVLYLFIDISKRRKR